MAHLGAARSLIYCRNRLIQLGEYGRFKLVSGLIILLSHVGNRFEEGTTLSLYVRQLLRD